MLPWLVGQSFGTITPRRQPQRHRERSASSAVSWQQRLMARERYGAITSSFATGNVMSAG